MASELEETTTEGGSTQRAEPNRRVAVVTGGNRGLGYATVRKLCDAFNGTVVLAARNKRRAMFAVGRLATAGCRPRFHLLNIADLGHRLAFRDFLAETFGGLDVLVNNAGIKFPPNSTLEYRTQVTQTININFYATLCLCQVLFPLLRPHARVVNLTSPCVRHSAVPSAALRARFERDDLTMSGLLHLMKRYMDCGTAYVHKSAGWGNDAYCLSKIALAAMTAVHQRQLAAARPRDDILANSFSPGALRSRITNYVGNQSAADVAENVVALATLPPDTVGLAGRFVWHDLRLVGFKGRTVSQRWRPR